MNAEFFLDTNIFVYSFDETSPAKRKLSRKLIQRALSSGKGVISWQVIQEFLNVARHKWYTPMSASAANLYLETVLQPLCTVYPSMDLYSSALRIYEQTQYRYYDSLILSSAISSGAKKLYSEDLQDGRMIDGLEIQNPFL